jgi:hypothetical protein
MAETSDPNVAPTHSDVVERFATVHVVIAVLAGLAATTVGLILGLVLTND